MKVIGKNTYLEKCYVLSVPYRISEGSEWQRFRGKCYRVEHSHYSKQKEGFDPAKRWRNGRQPAGVVGATVLCRQGAFAMPLIFAGTIAPAGFYMRMPTCSAPHFTEVAMLDLVMSGLGIGFFAVALAYVFACERL